MNNQSIEFIEQRVRNYFNWEKHHGISLCVFALIGLIVGGWLFFTSIPLYVGIAIPLLLPLLHILFNGLSVLRNRTERLSSVIKALSGQSIGLRIEVVFIERVLRRFSQLIKAASGTMLVGCVGILIALFAHVGVFFLGLFTSIFAMATMAALYGMVAKHRCELYHNQLTKLQTMA